ncbi:MAG: sugar ABC transporter substrate-binding protein [Treponema sp.]|jgi:ABC-type sugar transport system substrate-binding protein|nr:sugar ABC transporter substrate-binding protein [Treponema sp.]
MEKRKRILTALIAVTLILGTVSSVFAAGGKQKDETITVGLALSAIQTNSIFIDMRRAVEKICQEKGYKLIAADLLEGPTKMVTFLENCLNANAKVVIFQNIAEDAYADLLQRLKDQGAILGSYDNPTNIAHYTSQASNYELGLTIGRETGKWVHANPGSKKVAICGYSLLDFLVVRSNGMKDGFKETCPEGSIVMEVDAGYVQQGVTAGETFLQAVPDIQAVMGINDSGPVGVSEAFKAAGMSFAKNGVALFGCDASEDGMRALREKDMFKCTIYLDVVNQVLDLFDCCLDYALTGKYDESKANVYFPMMPVYLENADIVNRRL